MATGLIEIGQRHLFYPKQVKTVIIGSGAIVPTARCHATGRVLTRGLHRWRPDFDRHDGAPICGV